MLAAGCSAAGGVRQEPVPDLGWPPEAPRVRLERVVALQDRPTGRMARFLRKLAAAEAATLLGRPYGAAWDGDDLLVTDPASGRVVRLDARGRVTSSPEHAFASPIGVAACPAGVVVSDSRAGRVALVGQNLEPVSFLAEGLERPTGVVCGGGRIYVVETGRHRVVVLEPLAGGEGEAAATEALGRRGDGHGEFNFPAAVALDGGSLWVGDTLNFRLQRLDAATGAFRDGFGRLGDAPGEMPRIKGVAVDSAGHLWVSDAHLDQVSLYRADGSFLMAIGGHGAGAGEFSFPAGVAAHPDGRVAVVDSLNRRVQIFRLVEPPAATRDTENAR